MKDLMDRTLNLAELQGAQYADVRVVEHRLENIEVKNGIPEAVDLSESLGLGVRVLLGGAWGFAASHELTRGEIDRVCGQAVEIARASALAAGEKVELGPPVTSQGTYQTATRIDPFEVSLEEKLALLLDAEAEMARVAAVEVRRGRLVFSREKKWFANSEGAFTEQAITESGGGIVATAVSEDEVQTRSYPNAFGRQQVTAGWEAVLAWDLPGHARQIAGEAAALLTADRCPAGITTTVILNGDQLALQIHESCGHAIELDRVFGTEAAYAGTSFLTPEKLDNFRYGSPVVNITADSSSPLGLGTFGWDDEGVAGQATPIVRDGIFVGYLMSRETAARIGRLSNGCMRASSWNRIPLIRMTNINLEPGQWELEDLIADTDNGVYLATNRSWSIDDRRYNFQFGTEIGYEIKNGKLGRMLRNCSYTGITPEFWRSCDAVCNEKHLIMWATPNCGKGQPSQAIHTGHRVAPARFRKVKLGGFKS